MISAAMAMGLFSTVVMAQEQPVEESLIITQEITGGDGGLTAIRIVDREFGIVCYKTHSKSNASISCARMQDNVQGQ